MFTTNSIVLSTHFIELFLCNLNLMDLDLDSGNKKQLYYLLYSPCILWHSSGLDFLWTNPKRTNLATVVREGHAKEEWA